MNKLNGFECPTRTRGRCEKRVFKIPKYKTQSERSSLKLRGSKLFNILLENEILTQELWSNK